MFCGECGAKNKKNDLFCSECGKPLVHEETNAVKVEKSTKQPLSKKNKIIIAVIIAIVCILGIGYKVGSDLTSPRKIAEDYIKATISQDGNKLYKYLELDGDKTFVSKKIFKELLKENKDDSSSVENYKITEVSYGDGELTAKVKYTYTVKGSTSEKTSTINLIKQKEKKFLIFDNWEISDLSSDSVIVKDYKIKVSKDSTVIYAGVKLTDKYLDKDMSTSKLDVYNLPQVFTANTTLNATLPNGIEIEEVVKPTTYKNTYTVTFDEDSITDAFKEKLTTKAKNVLTIIYENAIAKKTFSDIKSNFEHGKLDLSELETDYNDLVSDLSESSTTLTSISFTNVVLSDLELDEDGNLELEVKVNYDYSVSYKDYKDEVKTHDDTDYDYMSLTFVYEKDNFYLLKADDLDYYFSRY